MKSEKGSREEILKGNLEMAIANRLMKLLIL